MSRYRKDIGDFGENTAEGMLISKGYYILERQYRTKFGEIDIIAITPDKKAAVFIEVKTRKNMNRGMAAESVDKTKIKRLVRTAQQYLLDNPLETDIRFDVVEVYTDMGGVRVNHIENAFPDLSDYIDF